MALVLPACSAPALAQAGAGTEYDGAKLPGAASVGDEVVPARLVIDEERPLRSFEPRMFGFNWNWFFSNPMVVQPGTNELREDFIDAMRELPLPLQRMSGTESQYFRWRDAIGPLDGREPFSIRPYHQSPEVRVGFGPLEWVTLMRRINPDVELVWCLNLYQDGAADHADFAELMVHDGHDNANGGVDWAAFRRDAGVEEPAPITVWELGNELDEPWHHDRIPDVEAYIERCRVAIDAVRSVDPDARFAAHAVTAPWSENKNLKKFGPDGDWRSWHRRVLEELGDDLDYVVFHPYYAGWPTPKVYRFVDTISEDIRRITGSDRIRLYFSEHARWPPRPKQGPWSINFHKSHNLTALLAISEFINLGHSRDDVAMMSYHILHGGPWRTIDVTPDGRGFFFTGIADLFRLYQDTMAGEVVHATLSGPQTDVTQDSLSLSVLSTYCVDTKAIVVLLANRSESSMRSLSLETRREGYMMTDRWDINADDPDAHNTAEARPLAVKHRPLKGQAAPLTIDVPPLTVAVIRLMQSDAGAAPGGTVDASE